MTQNGNYGPDRWSEKVAITISGHRTRSVFERYNIVNEADLKMASGKINSLHNETRQRFGHNHGPKFRHNTRRKADLKVSITPME